jgi:hypothetical protein
MLLLNKLKVYNFTAQKDNQINQQISAAARKDGAAMKSIAILTMCFLPATFIAVSQHNPDNSVLILTLSDSVLYARNQLEHIKRPSPSAGL